MDREYHSVSEAATRLNVSASFLNKARIYGGGPDFVRFGRTVRYSVAALENYARKNSIAEDNGDDRQRSGARVPVLPVRK